MEEARFSIPGNFEVKSAQRVYPVEFSATIREVIEKLVKIKKPVFIIDGKVRRLYANYFDDLLSQFPTLEIEATEEAKSFEGVGAVVKWLSQNDVTKLNHIVAVGGGIVQEIAAFSSCIFFRGLTWSLVPTTLLSMSDSCIGAKCGINLGGFKNQLGAFYSPHRVLICPAFLDTLEPVDIKSGYGEILKHHLIGGYQKFLELERDIESAGQLLSEKTVKHISESLLMKKSVVEQDEFETHFRMILNFGHTFGHALEAETQNFVPHGLAVVWGIDFENFIAVKNGWLKEEKFSRIRKLIKKYISFNNAMPVTVDGLMAASRRDKKVTGPSEVNLIFLTDQDQVEIRKTSLDASLRSHLLSYLKEYDLFKLS